MKIFFSGPLTNLSQPEETKALFVKMADLAKANGCEPFWAFLNGTDPVKNPDVTPREVYERDIAALAASDVMISWISEPTTGTGQELEYAKEHNIPVYVMYKHGAKVSRMALGNPAVKLELVYENDDDALKQLDHLIKQLKTP